MVRQGSCHLIERYFDRKVVTMHWWNHPSHPLGGQWTLSPENYTAWGPGANGRDNTYLGYSLEGSCLKAPYVPFNDRPRQAYVLTKRLSYFLKSDYILRATSGVVEDQPKSTFFSDLSQKANLTFYAQYRHDVENIKPVPGITELPKLARPDFQSFLARSRVVVGIGWPLLSPSPWEALCLGVPFINPIRNWDKKNPDDRSKWDTQQNGLTTSGLDEPFVYHVRVGDQEGLRRAILKAMETPIER